MIVQITLKKCEEIGTSAGQTPVNAVEPTGATMTKYFGIVQNPKFHRSKFVQICRSYYTSGTFYHYTLGGFFGFFLE